MSVKKDKYGITYICCDKWAGGGSRISVPDLLDALSPYLCFEKCQLKLQEQMKAKTKKKRREKNEDYSQDFCEIIRY